MQIPAKFKSLQVSVAGESHLIELRVPAAGEVIPLFLDFDLRVESMIKATLMVELQGVIDTIDGELPTEDQIREIIADAEALAQVLHVRRGLYNFLAEQGRALAFCPYCPNRSVEIDLLFYWTGLRLPPWDFFDHGILMNPPSLASQLPSGDRPASLACASRLAYNYPSVPPLNGFLDSLQTPEARAREELAWRQWAPTGTARPEGKSHWRQNNTGFRAILRLSVALDPPASPSQVEDMPIGAFLFLDLLHFAANNVDVTDPDRLQVKCSNCERYFLPVLSARETEI